MQILEPRDLGLNCPIYNMLWFHFHDHIHSLVLRGGFFFQTLFLKSSPIHGGIIYTRYHTGYFTYVKWPSALQTNLWGCCWSHFTSEDMESETCTSVAQVVSQYVVNERPTAPASSLFLLRTRSGLPRITQGSVEPDLLSSRLYLRTTYWDPCKRTFWALFSFWNGFTVVDTFDVRICLIM